MNDTTTAGCTDSPRGPPIGLMRIRRFRIDGSLKAIVVARSNAAADPALTTADETYWSVRRKDAAPAMTAPLAPATATTGQRLMPHTSTPQNKPSAKPAAMTAT